MTCRKPGLTSDEHRTTGKDLARARAVLMHAFGRIAPKYRITSVELRRAHAAIEALDALRNALDSAAYRDGVEEQLYFGVTADPALAVVVPILRGAGGSKP